jgi:hypothetical protein
MSLAKVWSGLGPGSREYSEAVSLAIYLRDGISSEIREQKGGGVQQVRSCEVLERYACNLAGVVGADDFAEEALTDASTNKH